MRRRPWPLANFFFFNDTPTTEIYTLPLHDALPIPRRRSNPPACCCCRALRSIPTASATRARSEEHTYELQSRPHLVCRLLLEKKKKPKNAPSDIQNINTANTAETTQPHT